MDEKINKPSEGEEIIDITTEIAKDIPLPQTQQALESHQNINSSEKKEENTNFNITSKEASSFIKIIVSKDNLQISDFDENQQKFLKENGIINEEGILNSEKFQDFQKKILKQKNLLGENGEINQEEIKAREKGQEFLKKVYENPIKINYLLSKDSPKDNTELINGYADILRTLGCYQNGTFNSSKFNQLKKEIEERKKSDPEFEEAIKTPEENEIIKIKRELVTERLNKLNTNTQNKEFGQNITTIIEKNSDFFHEDPDKQALVQAMFSNSFFITNSFPTFFNFIIGQTQKQKSEFKSFEDIKFSEGNTSGIGKFTEGLNKEEKAAFFDFLTNKSNPKDTTRLDTIHQAVLGKYLAYYLTPDLLNGYVEDVYKQQFCKEKVDTSKRFKTEATKHTIKIEQKSSSQKNKKNQETHRQQSENKKEKTNTENQSTKNTYKKGVLATGEISSRQILEDAIEEDQELQEGLESLSDEGYQNQIKEIISNKFSTPRFLFNQVNKYFNGGNRSVGNFEEKEGEKKKTRNKEITFSLTDFYNKDQISNLFSSNNINENTITQGIQKKGEKIGLSPEEIQELQKKAGPILKEQFKTIKKKITEQILKKEKEYPKGIETKINEGILTDYLNKIRSTFASNEITKNFSFDGNVENNFGKEGIKIEKGNFYINGNLDNSPCTFCVELDTGEVKINTACSFTNDRTEFNFKQNEPNYTLFKVPSFKECQKQALDHITDFSQRNQKVKGNNTFENGDTKVAPDILKKLESRVSENEFYSVLRLGIQKPGGSPIENINEIGHPGLFSFFNEKFSRINRPSDFQNMTSFLQKIYQLGNLPEGIRKEEQNTSDILKNLFNHEKIQTDYKNLSTNKENSILMILSHFTHKKEDGSVIFENGTATKRLNAIGNNLGNGGYEQQDYNLKKIESEIFLGKGGETYKEYNNTELASYLKGKEEKSESQIKTGKDIDLSSAFHQSQFTPIN